MSWYNENLQMNLNNYKINLHKSKNNNILFEEYENIQIFYNKIE